MKRVGRALIRFGLRTLTATFFVLSAVLILSRHTETLEWPATLGLIEEFAAVRAGEPGDSRAPGERFRLFALYHYEIDGRLYESTRIAVFDWVYRSAERAGTYGDRFGLGAGERVPVYYNPDDPAEAVLIRHIPWNRAEVLLGVVLLVVLPVCVVLYSLFDVLRGGRSRGDDRSRGRFW